MSKPTDETPRDRWVRANGPCAVCGSTLNLEIDHIDPALKDPRLRKTTRKANDQAYLWAWPIEAQNAELAKCQVLCMDCHAKKTSAERMKPTCKAGHEWTEENTYLPYGRVSMRQCKTCKLARNRKYWAAKKASK